MLSDCKCFGNDNNAMLYSGTKKTESAHVTTWRILPKVLRFLKDSANKVQIPKKNILERGKNKKKKKKTRKAINQKKIENQKERKEQEDDEVRKKERRVVGGKQKEFVTVFQLKTKPCFFVKSRY